MDLAISEELMSEKRAFLRLMTYVQSALKQFTIHELNESFSKLILPSKEYTKSKEKKIEQLFDIICEEYKITKSELITSKPNQTVQPARIMTYCFLHFHLGMPIRHIANQIFKFKYHNNVGVHIKYYKELDVNLKPDKEFKDRMDAIRLKAIKQRLIKK